MVMVLLGPDDQEFFLSQYGVAQLPFSISGFPEPIMQTRAFVARLLQSAPRTGYRAALWEATMVGGEAKELNEFFIARTGNPMDPSAWAAYAAIKIIFETIAAVKTLDTSAIVHFLESPKAVFSVGKASAASFEPRSHQLIQSLLIVQANSEKEWGLSPFQRLALVDLVAELPARSKSDTKYIESQGVESVDSGCPGWLK